MVSETPEVGGYTASLKNEPHLSEPLAGTKVRLSAAHLARGALHLWGVYVSKVRLVKETCNAHSPKARV